jgi:hypothetical protein
MEPAALIVTTLISFFGQWLLLRAMVRRGE